MLEKQLLNIRSCRSFDESRKVTDDEFRLMVECARLTPSSRNGQPLRYRFVNSKEEVDAVLKLTKWAAALPDLELPPKDKHPTAFVVVCRDLLVDWGSYYDIDIGICTLAIYLKAAELGLSGCIIGSFDKVKLAKVLKIEEKSEPMLIIALGKANEERQITNIGESGTKYFRKNGIHYVPKYSVDDLII